jgi:hypothetical protein
MRYRGLRAPRGDRLGSKVLCRKENQSPFPKSFKIRKIFGTQYPQTIKYFCSGLRVEKHCTKA